MHRFYGRFKFNSKCPSRVHLWFTRITYGISIYKTNQKTIERKTRIVHNFDETLNRHFFKSLAMFNSAVLSENQHLPLDRSSSNSITFPSVLLEHYRHCFLEEKWRKRKENLRRASIINRKDRKCACPEREIFKNRIKRASSRGRDVQRTIISPLLTWAG